MATLTQTAYYARKIIKFGSIGIVALLILRIGYVTFKKNWQVSHPTPPPAPTVAFGKLPKLDFPPRENLPPITLKLETISGSLPTLSEQAKVFFVPQPSKSLLVWDNTKAWAQRLGFSQSPQETGTYDYRFVADTLPKVTLDVNVITRNFILAYDWRGDLSVVSQNTSVSESQATAILKSFLQGAQALADDLANGSASVFYLKYADGNMTKALFSSEANFVKVNLFRQDVEGIKIYPPNPLEGNVSALISTAYPQFGGIINLKFIHPTISYENSATYPLKSANEAWSQLAAGKGFVANLGNNPSGKVTIRKAYLAYYDSESIQNFLQPIIVFEGDNDFFAYVPAITDIWVEQ